MSMDYAEQVQKAIQVLTTSFDKEEAYASLEGLRVADLMVIENHFQCKTGSKIKSKRRDNIVNATVGARRQSHIIRNLDLK